MSRIEESNDDVRASSSQKIDKTLRFRGWNDWILISRSDPNVSVGEFRYLVGLERQHGAKQNRPGESLRPQQQNARCDIRAVRVADGNDVLIVDVVTIRCCGDKICQFVRALLQIFQVEYALSQ